jgi:hypothetical protein
MSLDVESVGKGNEERIKRPWIAGITAEGGWRRGEAR